MAAPAVQVSPVEREGRVRQWIQDLCELPERFAGSFTERAAAERVAEWMRQLGARDVSLLPVAGGPRGGFALALHTGIAALGCWWGGFLGVVLAIVAAWSFRAQFRGHRFVLSKFLPHTDSVNVVGSAGADTAARRVVLSAHIDTAQAGWIFSKQLADTFAHISHALRRGDTPPQGPLALPEALVVGAAIVTIAGWLGAHGVLFGLSHGVITAALLIACGLGLEWAMAVPTPGANDNASAVAAMLTCAERLLPTLPADVQLLLVGTGAEEVGCRGMHGFVASHTDWPRDSTYYFNFECVGGGALHIIRSEGILGKATYPPTCIELARRVAASGAFGEITPTDLLAATDGHVPALHGYPTLSLISLEFNGVPRNYHRPDDTVEGIDCAMVVRAADFAAAVAAAALRGDAGPIALRE
jgi:peptidase M28-like protein